MIKLNIFNLKNVEYMYKTRMVVRDNLSSPQFAFVTNRHVKN